MNTKIKFTRFAFALALTLSALGVSAPAALAAQPTKFEGTLTVGGDITDVCSFTVHNDAAISFTEIDFLDKSGALTRIFSHSLEQDTFTANGKTLVSIPYTFNMEVLFDSSGNVTHVFADGVLAKIPLPDGSLFVSAGRVDFTAHPGAIFILSPDKGNPGNVAGFCAALAP
jgi:hypothetical protein